MGNSAFYVPKFFDLKNNFVNTVLNSPLVVTLDDYDLSLLPLTLFPLLSTSTLANWITVPGG